MITLDNIDFSERYTVENLLPMHNETREDFLARMGAIYTDHQEIMFKIKIIEEYVEQLERAGLDVLFKVQ
jgi:hypothetical protein